MYILYKCFLKIKCLFNQIIKMLYLYYYKIPDILIVRWHHVYFDLTIAE